MTQPERTDEGRTRRERSVRPSDTVAFTLEGIDQEYLTPIHRNLTPNYLNNNVVPYIKAVADIQHIIDELSGRAPQEIIIKKISQQSPINVSLEGAYEAVVLIVDIVIPWRRRHGHIMAYLSEREKESEIEIKKAEVLAAQSRAAKEQGEAKKLAAEASKQYQEAQKLRLENEQLRMRLERDKIELVLNLLERISPFLGEEQKIIYVTKLLPTVSTLISSDLEIPTLEKEAKE